MRRFPCYLYHICREKDKYDFSKGYIGVSTKPRKRWGSGGYKQNPHLHGALKKYPDIIKYVIKIGTVNECLANERTLRPQPNMGWNLCAGGGMPPSPKITGNCISKIPQRRQEYSVTEETRKNISKAQLKISDKTSARMKGELNPMWGVHGRSRPNFKGYYITPKGKFETSKEVEETFGISKPTVQNRCKIGGVIKHNRWTPKEWFGMSWEELGWGFEYVQ